MAPTCGVCATQESKYKCPVCQLRYCSIPCYKSHKAIHEAEKTEDVAEEKPEQQQQRVVDRPGTKQRAPKIDFTGFENDTDFQRLLTRYPKLRHQLQLVYGVTLEPGPTETGWNRRDWFPDGRNSNRGAFRDRGRGRGRGGFRGRGGHNFNEIPPEDRMRGPWSQEKGDKQGLAIIHNMRKATDEDLAEGMSEFLEFCQIKFGQKS